MNAQRTFGPKQEDHPGVGQPCPACKVPFAAGDYTTLGPGDDPEARMRAVTGRAYNVGREPTEEERR